MNHLWIYMTCWNRETHAVLGPQPGKVGGAFLQQRLESHLLEAALTRQGFGHILRQWDGSAKQQTCSNAGRASAQQSLLHALHLSKKKSNRFQKSSRKFGINRHANKHLVECSDNLHCSGEHDQYRGWLCILACHLQNVHASV